MKIIGVIPARYQSSRFPQKPIALICGRPMIWWVYRQAVQVTDFDEVVVATDHAAIYRTCQELGIPAVMTKETHLTGTDRLGEVASRTDADFFVNIQGDEPMIEPEIIQSVIDYKAKHPKAEVINTMTPLLPGQDVQERSIVKAAAAANGNLLYLSRAPIPGSKDGMASDYKRHLGLYGLSREALLFFSRTQRGYLEKREDVEMLRFLENGYTVKILEVASESIGVDLPEDVGRVEEAMRACAKFPC